jgi:ubiquinone biosynthesis protein
MSEQIGVRGLLRTLRSEAPYWAGTLPQLPRLLHRALAEDRDAGLRRAVDRLVEENRRRNDLLSAMLLILLGAALALALAWVV